MPKKGKFRCSCGQQDDIIASIRTLPQDQRLPVRPYALQAIVSFDPNVKADNVGDQGTFFDRATSISIEGSRGITRDAAKLAGFLIPDNGKFYKRFGVSDMRRLQRAEAVWEQHKSALPYPTSAVPLGEKTKSGLLSHHYNFWHELFGARQMLALSTLLQGIMSENDQALKEMLMCAFSNTVEANNLFVRNRSSRNTPGGTAPGGIFSRHDFQPKSTSCEQNVWGVESGTNSFIARMELLKDGINFRGAWVSDRETIIDPLLADNKPNLRSAAASDGIDALESNFKHVVTDPPYVGNVNYAELADFFYVWVRLALKDTYTHFAPEYTPKLQEIVENSVRKKNRKDFFNDLAAVFHKISEELSDDGLLTFTFHHTDQEGKVWEGLLEALCETGFEIIAVYPIHAESETSLHLMNKENISYDLIHVCRKRKNDIRSRSWAGVRQEVRRKAREELQAIEQGRYGNQPLPEPDVRLICIGKCLELYSAHYGKVLDHDNRPLPLHKALQDISAIVDQLVTKDRPLPSELEAVDALSYVWLRVLAPIRNEVMMDAISKSARGMQVSVDDLKDAGLVVRGRTGRGRTYEVKQPAQRLGELLAKYQPGLKLRVTQGELFTSEGQTIFYDIPLVDLVHLVIGLAQAGESVVPWLERFAGLRSQLGAALRYIRDIRVDWKDSIDRVLALIEGAPLIRQIEEA